MSFWEEGPDWVVGWDTRRVPYCTLLGGADWSFELTAPETALLLVLLKKLEVQQQASLTELMDAEALTLTAGAEGLELQIAGYPGEFALRIRLLNARGTEGRWEAQPAQSVCSALGRLALKLAVLGLAGDNESGSQIEIDP